MSEENPERQGEGTAPEAPVEERRAGRSLLELPGLAAIALYMLILAGTVIQGVAGGHFPPLYLLFPVFFIAAGFGLLMRFRWAWALALAAVALLAALYFFAFASRHASFGLALGLINLVFFLYLMRGEVRAKLR